MKILSILFVILVSPSSSIANVDLINAAIENSIEEVSESQELSKKIIEVIGKEDPEKGIDKTILKKQIKPWLKALDQSMKTVLSNSTSLDGWLREDEQFYDKNAYIIESENNVIGRIFDYNLETRIYWKEYFKGKSDKDDFYNAQTAVTRLEAQLPTYMKYLESLAELMRS